jgi:EpsI family protein
VDLFPCRIARDVFLQQAHQFEAIKGTQGRRADGSVKIQRLITLELIVLFGLGTVFLLPKKIEIERAAINLALPDFVGDWYGADQPVSQGEKDILGPDTQFVRKLYTNATGDQIFVSIVFSGPDMSTSIHRPERCLPAQGWTVDDTRITQIPNGTKLLRATRLHNLRIFRNEKSEPVSVYALNYYWFVGHDATTPSHYERTWIDIRDRVLKGENQQWAYVTVASTITTGLQSLGRSEKETDEMMRDFIRALAPHLQSAPPSEKSSS